MYSKVFAITLTLAASLVAAVPKVSVSEHQASKCDIIGK